MQSRNGRPRRSSRAIVYLQFGADADLRLPRAWVVERSAELVTELQLPVS